MIRARNGMPLPFVDREGRILHGPHCSCTGGNVPGTLAGEPHPMRPPKRCGNGVICPNDKDPHHDSENYAGTISVFMVPAVFLAFFTIQGIVPWLVGVPIVAAVAAGLYGVPLFVWPWLDERKLGRLKAHARPLEL